MSVPGCAWPVQIAPEGTRAQKERDRAPGAPGQICPRKGLLQRSADAYKVRAELVAETVHGGDDRNRDTGCNQAIFNGRGS